MHTTGRRHKHSPSSLKQKRYVLLTSDKDRPPTFRFGVPYLPLLVYGMYTYSRLQVEYAYHTVGKYVRGSFRNLPSDDSGRYAGDHQLPETQARCASCKDDKVSAWPDSRCSNAAGSLHMQKTRRIILSLTPFSQQLHMNFLFKWPITGLAVSLSSIYGVAWYQQYSAFANLWKWRPGD